MRERSPWGETPALRGAQKFASRTKAQTLSDSGAEAQDQQLPGRLSQGEPDPLLLFLAVYSELITYS